jgi:hypothetical protein
MRGECVEELFLRWFKTKDKNLRIIVSLVFEIGFNYKLLIVVLKVYGRSM